MDLSHLRVLGVVFENRCEVHDPAFEEACRASSCRQHRADRTAIDAIWMQTHRRRFVRDALEPNPLIRTAQAVFVRARGDRKSTRLNSSHEWISYAVFCLKKKIK